MESLHLNPEREFLLRMIDFNKRIVQAHGSYLYDDQKRSYLDFSSQYGSVPFGYNPDFLWEALDRVKRNHEPSFIQPLTSIAAEKLSKLLIECAPKGLHYACFTNSGAESVEAAIKLSRSKTGRQVILATQNSFHGKTLGAVSATGREQYRSPFLVDTTGFDHISFNNLDALEARLAQKDVAAFFVEPVQGEGGMVVPSHGYLQGAKELCAKYGALLVLDEVQTGFGRTGKLFAADHEGVCPDILLLAKALGGGLVPLGAMLVKKEVWTKEFGLYHSSTFANNHLTCSVGLAVLERLLAEDRQLIKHVASVGTYLRIELDKLVQSYPDVFASVSGLGLMQAIKLRPWSGDESYFLGMAGYKGYCVPFVSGYLLNEHRILAIPTLNNSGTLRIQPALTIKSAEIDRIIYALRSAAELIRNRDFASLLSYMTGKKVGTDHRPTRREKFGKTFPQPEHGQRRGSFAFFIHPTEFEDVMRSLPQGCESYPLDQIQRMREWMREWNAFDSSPGVVYHLPCIQSKLGGYVEGWLISCTMTPQEMMRLNKREKKDLIEEYFQIARNLKVDIIGLGAFTSIITRAGTEIESEDIRVTTGNSLTAMAASESLCTLAEQRGLSLNSITGGVIGAAGSVGRLAAINLSLKIGRLVLFGNPANKSAITGLESLAGEIYRHAIQGNSPASEHDGIRRTLLSMLGNFDFVPPELLSANRSDANQTLYRLVQERVRTMNLCAGPVELSVDLPRDLPRVDALISATNQGKAFIEPVFLGENLIVCDAARPADVQKSVNSIRPDVLVYEGGLIQLPDDLSFGRNNVIGLPSGVNLACLSETVCLSMEGVSQNYSIGLNVPLEEAHFIYETALKHGFRLSLPGHMHEEKPRHSVSVQMVA